MNKQVLEPLQVHLKKGMLTHSLYFVPRITSHTHCDLIIQLNLSVISNLLPLRTHQPGNATLN